MIALLRVFLFWRKAKKPRAIVGFLQAKQQMRKLTRSVDKVFIHCSDSDAINHDNIRVIKHWHFYRGFSDVGYHFYIRKSGQIQIGRNINQIPAAQKGFNRGSIAICLGGRHKFTNAQFASLKALCKYINYRQKKTKQELSFYGHNHVNKGKTCPNFNVTKQLNLNEFGKLKA